MQMVMSMKASGTMTKLMAMVHTNMQMGQPMLVIGSRTNNTVRELKNGPMVPNMRGAIKTERRMATDVLHLLMEVTTQVNLKIMKYLD